MTTQFNADEMLQNLSGLELMKVAEWLKENKWWDVKAEPLSEVDETFVEDATLLIENLQYLTEGEKAIIGVLAKRFKGENF